MGRKVIALSSVLLLLGAFAYGIENDPNGTWKVTRFFGQDGLSSEASLTLTLDGNKLTGTLTQTLSGKVIEISDGTFKDKEIAFTLNSVRKTGKKSQDKFLGVLMGDTFKGKSVTVIDELGIKAEVEWKAERLRGYPGSAVGVSSMVEPYCLLLTYQEHADGNRGTEAVSQ